jgi:hypothetical protein
VVIMSATEEIRAQALEVAGGWSAPGAPESWRLTAALFQAIAAHEELLRHGVFAVLGARTFDDGPDHGDPDHGDPDHGDPDHGDPDHGDPDHGDPDHGDPSHRHTDRARLLARAHPSGEWVEWLD